MKFMTGVCAAMAISTVTAWGQAQAPVQTTPGTEKVTPQIQQQARNLTEEITTVGCIRAWKPAPEDVTKLPENREPGMAGMFLLTPLSTSPTAAIDLPTYLLTPTASANFQQHLDRKVEIVGVAQTAPLPPTVQEIATAPTQRPENRPNAQSFPRLTVKSITRVGDTCPS
ncbi:MAG TPA: hypothetical protein VFV51_11380 [Vicinamibacterales bacterium]|nr:hypothetical protein [Vicinamibacterales bacterium]